MDYNFWYILIAVFLIIDLSLAGYLMMRFWQRQKIRKIAWGAVELIVSFRALEGIKIQDLKNAVEVNIRWAQIKRGLTTGSQEKILLETESGLLSLSETGEVLHEINTAIEDELEKHGI